MNEHAIGAGPGRLSSRSFVFALAVLAAVAVVVGEWLGPVLVRGAYGGDFGPLAGLITGRADHPEAYYVTRWLGLARLVYLALGTLLGLAYFVLVRGTSVSSAIGVGICVGWGLASLSFPFGWDQGIFAAVGDATVRGGMPYRDGWDMKGPLAFQVYAVSQLLFGRTMWGIRVLELPLLFAGAWAMARVVGALTSRTVGLWSGVALVLWIGTLGYFRQSQPDGWVALLMTLCAAALWPAEAAPRTSRFVLAGWIIGLTLLVKPTFGAFFLVPLLVGLLHRRSEGGRWLLRVYGATLAASLVPGLLTAAWFAARGAFADLVDVHLVYSASVYAAGAPIGLTRRVTGVVRFLWQGEFAVVLPLVLFGAWALWRHSRPTALLALAWLGAGFVGVVVQGRFFVYHWLPVFPPTVLLGAFGLWTVSRMQLGAPSHGSSSGGAATADAADAVSGRSLAIVAACCVLLSLAVAPAKDVSAWAKWLTGMTPDGEYYDRFDRPTDRFVAGDDARAAAHIKAHSSEGDRVAIFGYNATIPYLSDRPLASRFVFSLPLIIEGPFKERYRAEYVRDVRENRALYLIVGNSPRGSKDRDIAGYPELSVLLADRYELERSFGYVDLYRLRDLEGP